MFQHPPSFGLTRAEKQRMRQAAHADALMRREARRLARKARRALGIKGAPIDWAASTTARQEAPNNGR